MKNVIILFFLLFFFFSITYTLGQTKFTIPTKIFTPLTTTIFHKIGDDFIRIRTFQYGEKKAPFFIALHDDEVTAIAATERFLEENGGLLVRIDNNKKRNVRFRMNGRMYTFDPNRIFSMTGISQTLAMFGRIDSRSIDEVDKFAKRILQLLPDAPECIISLHNNTNGQFSITSYMKGQEREKDAKAIRLAPDEDPDDLFLTTEDQFFEKLIPSGFNVILQDNKNAKKDGSLSIYCGEQNIPYLNCETEHGRLTQYQKMINFAVTNLKKHEPLPQPLSIRYHYTVLADSGTIALSKGDIIYFGEKKVGTIENFGEKKGGNLEMTGSFPLYDNMDFYIRHDTNGSRRIELRIDPTRPKKSYDSKKDIIPLKVAN